MAIDKAIDSSALDAAITYTAQRIRAKTGGTAPIPWDAAKGLGDAVDGISAKISVEWHQCPEMVRNYLANVTYDPSDYSASSVETYLTNIPADSQLVGKTIDGVTYYNEIPGKQTPFASANAAGTLKPLDSLRMIYASPVVNIRDLGGWPCDGGTVKYGKLFRGGALAGVAHDVLVDQCGVRVDLDLRGTTEAGRDTSPLGDDVTFVCPENIVWYSLADKDTWREILRCIFDNVSLGRAVYYHCAAGADRTGTVSCIIELLLGMAQSDVDKDYELTSFAGDGYLRKRTYATGNNTPGANWAGLINAIAALDGTTMRDKVVTFVASLGFTAAEINAFRVAMIDGTPETLTLDIDTYTVTNTLTNTTSDNAAASATEYQPYTAKITPANGYVISSVQVKMGGVDVTGSVWAGTRTELRRTITATLTGCLSDNNAGVVIDGQSYAAVLTADTGYTLDGAAVSITMGGTNMAAYYKDGVIAIPRVTGDLVITVTAVKQAQENMFPAHFFDADGTTVFGSWKGYENGYRFGSDSGVRDGATGRSVTGYLDVSGYTKMVVSGSTVGSAQGGYPVVWYDSSRNVLSKGGEYITTSVPDGTWDIPSGANYVRLSCGKDPVDLVVNLD